MSSPLIVQLDLAEFCEAADLSDVYVIEIVEHGILEPQGAQPREWRFTADALALAKRAAKLRRDLELEWEGVALALAPVALFPALTAVIRYEQRRTHVLDEGVDPLRV